MNKILATLVATGFATSLSQAQVATPQESGLIPKTATLDINTAYANNRVETGDISITSNGNIVPCWEDDGSTITDWEAVWTVYSSNGVPIIPAVTMTNLPNAQCIPDALSVPNFTLRAFYRSDGSPTPGYTGDYGGKLKANQFGDGFMFCAGADGIGCEVPEMMAINNDNGGAGFNGSPIVQLLNNDGSRNSSMGGPDVAGIVSFSDADTEPDGTIRPGDVEFLANGNILIVGESRQAADRAMTGQAGGNVVVYKVLNAQGGVVHPYSSVYTNAASAGDDIWHGTAATTDGFMVRWNSGTAKFRLFDNNGNPTGPVQDLATVAGHVEAGAGGKGDSLGFKSNGKDTYALFVPNPGSNGSKPPWLTVLNADGTLRFSQAVVPINADNTTYANGDRGDVAVSDDGSVVVAFDASNNDPNNPGYRLPQGRLFSRCGQPMGPVFYISERDNATNSTVTGNGTARPRVAFRGKQIAFMWASDAIAPRVLAMRLFDVGTPPTGTEPVVPCSVEAVGMKYVTKDTLVWFSNSKSKPQIGSFVAGDDVANGSSVEAGARLLGDSTFLLAASTHATNDSSKISRTLVLIPANGSTPKLTSSFFDDNGVIYLKDDNTVRQDGNPGRVGGDMRYGAVNYMAGAEATLFNFPASFNSDGRYNNTFFNSILNDGTARTYAAQNYKLDPTTLNVTVLNKAQDVMFYPEHVNDTPAAGQQTGRTGSSPVGLANGNFVIVGEDRSKVTDPTSGNVAVGKIYGPDGSIVVHDFQVSPVGSNGSMWESVGAWSGGFFAKPQGGIAYCYDNSANLLGTIDVNTTANVNFDTGRSDGTRYCSDIRSHYMFAVGKSPESSGYTNMILCAWDLNTRTWITNTLVGPDASVILTSGGHRGYDRANIACDAYNRVTVVYRCQPDTAQWSNNQIAARIYQFDGTKFIPLTPEFWPFVEHDSDPAVLAGFIGQEPSVAMTPREILVYAEGSWNADGNPTNTVVTASQTHCYTIIALPAQAQVAAPRPTASVARSATGHAIISWDTAAGLFKVQSTTSLAAPVSWSDVTTGNVASGVDAGAIGNTPTYYRLIR